MNWQIPAKTFLLGEYVALEQGPALLITTEPCFTLSLSSNPGLQGVHPDSPAGRLWQDLQNPEYGLSWQDPYKGLGGLGASSAQFIGAYYAQCHIQNQKPSIENLLTAYYQYAFQGVGLRPSGYDVIAQAVGGCVCIDKGQVLYSSPWPFPELSFILLHTGSKLATHQHLQSIQLPKTGLEAMAALVYQAQQAFAVGDTMIFIDCVNQYHFQLIRHELVAYHSCEQIKELSLLQEIVGIKGCGALGADVLLVLVLNKNKKGLLTQLADKGFLVLATEEDILT